MAGYPPFSPNDGEVHHEWLNEVERARRAATVEANAGGSYPGDHRITVVVVRAPAAGAKSIPVRRVRYDDKPPRECDTECYYAYDGPEFEAYPDIPHKAADYAEFAIDSDPLDAEATYLKAHFEAGTYRVEKPAAGGGGAFQWAVIRTVTFGIIRVQPFKWTGTVGGIPTWAIDGPEIDVRAQPMVNGSLAYVFLAQPFLNLTTGMSVPIARDTNGEWYIMCQGVNLQLGSSSSLPVSSCASV